ncbi:MAG: M20/M25/M40 family metallo-hydrolase [Candidatus Binataceae bacterium]
MPETSATSGPSSASIRDPAYSSGPIVLVLAIILTIAAIEKSGPPPVVGADAPATDFSAARAMPDLRNIAARTHPLASAENGRVRSYLTKRLTELGVAPEIQTAAVATVTLANPSGLRTFAIVNNIVARIPGSASTGAIMLVAHYDSVPSGPGAGDDSAAVAAILQTIRALKSDPPLRNDLIVLFTDGEELGALGAKAFVENYPALREVRVALNFEMYGDYGPVVMSQASHDNAWLIRALAATPFPRAGSSEPADYRHIPSDSDLSVFLRAGIAGMNFAATRGLTRYHTRLDNIANLDPRSMQHQGSYALSLAREFGGADLSRPHAGDAIYFSAFGEFVHYPAALAISFAILALVVFVIALVEGVRRGTFSIGGICAGLGIHAAAIMLSLVESIIVRSMFMLLAARAMLQFGTSYGGPFFIAASTAVIVATLCAIYWWLARHVSRANLAAGALAIWTLLALACSVVLPSASFLLTWPLLFAALALNFRSSEQQSRDPTLPIVAALVAVIPCAVMLGPIFIATGDATPAMFGWSAVLAVLMFGIFIPYIDLLSGNHEGLLAAVLAAAGVLLFATGLRESRFSDTQPRPDSIFYMLDANSSHATWASLDHAPDRFTAQFFQSHVRAGSLALLTGESSAPAQNDDETARKPSVDAGRFCRLNGGATIEGDAPAAELAAPELRVLNDSTTAGVRTMTMHIASARGASIVWITIARGVEVMASSIDGKSPGIGASNGYSAWFWGVPDGGFDLTLKLGTTGPVRINLIDQTDWLPSFPGMPIIPRSADLMPTPFLFFDSSTLVRTTFIVGGLPTIPNA